MRPIPLRFNSEKDYEDFLNGDDSKAIRPFVMLGERSVNNREWEKAPFELTFQCLKRHLVIED